MKLGILGGTFNPVHKAHLYLAGQYRRELELDTVLFIPTFIPPHKRVDELADASDRLEMCRLAIQDIPGFGACDFEIRRGEVSYTLTTLEYLRGEYPEAELFLLMGADMFLTIQDWRRPEDIYRLAALCAAARESGEYGRMLAHQPSLEAAGARCHVLRVEPMPMSSTEIRRRIKEHAEMAGYLPPPVWDYIRERGLYHGEAL
jgi:nicotinate-nucleotide adenylyltransferase